MNQKLKENLDKLKNQAENTADSVVKAENQAEKDINKLSQDVKKEVT